MTFFPEIRPTFHQNPNLLHHEFTDLLKEGLMFEDVCGIELAVIFPNLCSEGIEFMINFLKPIFFQNDQSWPIVAVEGPDDRFYGLQLWVLRQVEENSPLKNDGFGSLNNNSLRLRIYHIFYILSTMGKFKFKLHSFTNVDGLDLSGRLLHFLHQLPHDFLLHRWLLLGFWSFGLGLLHGH